MEIIELKETMSSREIARITGKPHNDVMKSIRRMENAWEKLLGEIFPSVNTKILQGENYLNINLIK